MKQLRSRNYFLTINKSAECYTNFVQLVQQENNCDYFLIYHNKGLDNEHIHCVLLYYNARAFTSVMKKYNGAHIEVCHEVNKCLGYLIHFGNPDKVQYDALEVISSVDYLTIFSKYCQIETLEPFNPNLLVQYIKECEGSIYLLTCRFGASAIKNYRALINDILKDNKYIEWKEET